MIGVFIKRGKMGTETHTQENTYGDEGQDWGEVEAMEHQKHPANHQRPGERHGTDSHSQPSEGTNPRDNLILHF